MEFLFMPRILLSVLLPQILGQALHHPPLMCENEQGREVPSQDGTEPFHCPLRALVDPRPNSTGKTGGKIK